MIKVIIWREKDYDMTSTVFKSKIVSKKCTVSIFRCVVPFGLSLESKGSPKK